MEVARGVNLNPGSPPASGARGLLSQDVPLSTQDSRSKQGHQGPVPSPATIPGWSTPDGAPGTPREVGLSSPEEPPLTAAPLISGFPESSVGKESACSEGDLGSIPGWGRSPGGGNSNPLQYSCLKNPVDRGAWWAAVPGVTERRTQVRTEHPPPRSLACLQPSATQGSQPRARTWTSRTPLRPREHLPAISQD